MTRARAEYNDQWGNLASPDDGVEQAKEALSSRMLKDNDAGNDPDFPALDEKYLKTRERGREINIEDIYNKSTRKMIRIPTLPDCVPLDPVLAAYRWALLWEAIDACGIVGIDYEIIELTIYGHTTREIAEIVGFKSHSTVIEHMLDITKTLRAQLPNSFKYWMWELLVEVFGVRMVKDVLE